jgi:hypothetical protein
MVYTFDEVPIGDNITPYVVVRFGAAKVYWPASNRPPFTEVTVYVPKLSAGARV